MIEGSLLLVGVLQMSFKYTSIIAPALFRIRQCLPGTAILQHLGQIPRSGYTNIFLDQSFMEASPGCWSLRAMPHFVIHQH